MNSKGFVSVEVTAAGVSKKMTKASKSDILVGSNPRPQIHLQSFCFCHFEDVAQHAIFAAYFQVDREYQNKVNLLYRFQICMSV